MAWQLKQELILYHCLLRIKIVVKVNVVTEHKEADYGSNSDDTGPSPRQFYDTSSCDRRID